MSDRDVPFEPDAICDCCGRKGAWDFMGDFICQECAEGITEAVPDMLTLIDSPDSGPEKP